MKKIYFLFFLIPIFSFSQKKEGQALIDSLLVELPKMKEDTLKVNLLNDLSTASILVNAQKGLKFAIQALQLSKKINWKKGEASANLGISENQFKLVNYEESIKFAKNSLLIYKNLNNKKGIAICYRNLAQNYYDKKDISKAFQFQFESLKINEEINDKVQMANIYGNLAVYYHNQSDVPKAKQYELKSIAINEVLNNKKNLFNNYYHMVRYCRDHIDNAFAMEYSLKCLKISLELKDNDKIGKAYVTLASAYQDGYNFIKAKENYLNALNIVEKNGDVVSKIRVYSNIGSFYSEWSDHEKSNKKKYLKQAQDYIQKAISINENKTYVDLQWQEFCHAQLSMAQEKNGDFENSLKSFKTASIFKDSIFNSENKETIKNLEDKREIDLRDKEIKINKLAIEAQQKQKLFYILGIGSLVILGGLLFYQSRNRKKNNEKLQVLNSELDQANKIKTRFFSILNHDLRSPVSNLIHFLHLQQNNPELLDEETKTRMQTKTITGAENLLSSMEDILLWSKGQMENFKPQPKNVSVNQLFEDTKKVFSGYLKIKFEYQIPDDFEIFTDENYLKTIVRNLTSNAINVFVTTENPTIIWKAWQENHKSFLSITDNGSGSSQDKFKALYDDSEVVGIKTGLGLHLIRDLAKAIACEISVDSKIGVGTTFVLKL
jgi:signal transduction histidine kinase